MIFNTWLFAAFGALVFVLYWYVIPRSWRAVFLMAAGLGFYAASIPVYTILITALAGVTFGIARWLLIVPENDIVVRRIALTCGVVASVGVLVVFKYAKLFASTFNGVCHNGCINVVPDLVVPLAISFFTFEFVHVVIDVRLGKIKSVGLRDFWVFSLFFPTMVAGPIKRYQNFVPQIDKVLRMKRLDGMLFATGVFRVVLGLAKKTIFADSMNPFVQPLLMPAGYYTHLDYWIAALAYAVKIYFDFSGYSDIAIGFALLLGFQILENFDRPYWAPNISQFWRRWHISLSSWIRDYVFIPLGGSRRGKVVTLVNLTVVMALAGLWHGAAWHFVVWGLWNGAGLGIHRVWGIVVGDRVREFAATSKLITGVSIAGTFLFVILGWVLFECPSISVAIIVYEHMLGL